MSKLDAVLEKLGLIEERLPAKEEPASTEPVETPSPEPQGEPQSTQVVQQPSQPVETPPAAHSTPPATTTNVGWSEDRIATASHDEINDNWDEIAKFLKE